MSVASRIEEMYQHVDAVYNVLELAGKDLTNVDKNLVNLTYTWRERLLYFMNNGTDDVWNNWDKVSGTGTTLSLNNTEEAPMSLTYKGNTSQTGTPTPTSPIPVQVVSGDNSIEVVEKNLFKPKTQTQSMYGYPCKIGETFTLSFTGSTYSGDKRVFLRTYDGEFSTTMNDFVDAQVITITATDANYSITLTSTINGFVYVRFGGAVNSYTMSNIQLEKNNQATTYEEYKGASYPISLGNKELCKIGTYQDKIDKSKGNNLVNVEDYLSYAVSYSKNTDGSYTFATGGNFYTQGLQVNIDKGCTVSYKIKNGTGTNFRLRYKYENGTYGELSIGSGTGTGEVEVSNIIPQSNIDTRGKVVELVGNWSTQGTFTIRDFMVNYGDTALPYEPYGTCWYLKKEIGKVVLNENSNVGVSVSTNYSTCYLSDLLNVATTTSSSVGYSNYFKINYNNVIGNAYFTSSKYLYMIMDTSINNSATFKAWLGNNNVEVYYILATPTYETITDTTLIGQLEALKKSYEEQTNISQVNNDLPFELNITALSNE